MSLSSLFRKIGFIVGKRPKTIFLTNLFLFLPSLSYYLINDIKVETDVRRGFSPKNGRATVESKAFAEFYNVSIDGVDLVLIFLEPKTSDKRLIMNDKLLSDVEILDRYIKELSMEIKIDGFSEGKNDSQRVVRLKDFKTSKGDMNYLFHAFKWAYQLQSTSLLLTSESNKQINLDFPISQIYGFDVLLDSHFFGVKLREGNNSEKFPSKIESVETIGIYYLLDGNNKNKNQMGILNNLELKFFNNINNGDLKDLTFKILIYTDQLANYEMMRSAKKITSLLGIGVVAMILFLVVAFWHFNWKSQFILITSSLLSPLLSISVAFSIIGWIGIKFNSIMPIMPFLVFGIGVDNAFLLIHSWRKWALIEQSELNENEEITFAQRMANVFGEMDSSIAITSLTNGIAFGVGIFSPSSLMSNFCLCTSIAIFLDFLFEFLIFAPCLPFIKWKIEENESTIKGENWPLFGIMKLRKERPSSFSSSFLRFYSKFLVSFRAKISIFVLLFISYILAYFGINQMETSFIPERTFPGDSPLQDTIKIFNRIMKYHSPISFFVFHPPNISDPVEVNNFNKMINIIQNLPNTLHVQIWLNGYLEYHKIKINLNNSINYQPNYSLVPQFLKERRMDDKRIVQFRDFGLGNISVDSFVFGISRGGDLNWLERAFFVDKIRNIVDQFPKFNVSVFDYDSTIYDLILGVKTEMLKAVFVTLTCMALICFFVIPTLRCTGIATFSVLSISYTLLGTLGWCGQDIDPVTMINLLMAIGLSVDFSAHICYHFDILQEKQKEIQTESPIKNIKIFEQKEIEKRIEQILEIVGRPMLEAVISTIICIFPLFFISIEIIASFARTVLFLGIIGTIHGLFIVPVLLTIQINGLKMKKAAGFTDGSL